MLPSSPQAFVTLALPLLALQYVLLGAGGAAAGPAHVAVVGAGTGGAFAAHFLRELLGPDAAITVFEGRKIGGRVEDLTYAGHTYELGASVVYKGNYYVVNATDRLGLRRQPVDEGIDLGENLAALWDGSSFVFSESSSAALSLWRAWLRWGFKPLQFKEVPTTFFRKFKDIYRLQDDGVAFDTPREMLDAMQCYDVTQQRYSDYVRSILGNSSSASLYESEFLEAVNRVNYGQTNDQMNAFAGLVSAIAALDGDHLFQVQGGNAMLCSEMLKQERVVQVTARIVEVARQPDGRYLLTSKEGAATGGDTTKRFGPFDAVVIATPLEAANISFVPTPSPRPLAGNRTYQRTHTTYVVGELNPAYFGVKALPSDLRQILVTKKCTGPFNSIAVKGVVPSTSGNANATVVKIFSPFVLTDKQLAVLFKGHHEIVAHRDWAAYPKFKPPESFLPFVLGPGIAYNNAIDNAASAIEMSAIAARNSALLVHRHIQSARSRSAPQHPSGGPGVQQRLEARMVTPGAAHAELR